MASDSIARRVAIAVCVVAVAASACCSANGTSTIPTSSVAIRSATLSVDEMRFLLNLTVCGVDLKPTVDEDDSQVVVTVLGAPDPLGRECDENIIVELASPFGQRRLIDGSIGAEVSVSNPPPEERAPWPYDRTQFDEGTYLQALEDMVTCIEQDPLVDGWIGQWLDWKWYFYEVKPDENGSINEGPLFNECREQILEPLR